MRHLISVPLLLLFITTGCRDDEEISIQEKTYNLNGYVQKGPFINGTAITVSELDKRLVATGKNFTTQIVDNKGAFSLRDVKLQSDFVQLIAEGFYFDEVRGEKSAAQLTLFALADVSDANSVNVNLLSHLEKARVIYLMQEEEESFVTAKQQAQQEILSIFGIEKAGMMASELLDISQDGEDNAILLAISAILQSNNSVAELSELLANLITDIREDGVLDSESTWEKIRGNAMALRLPDIRQHLEVRYEELGVDVTIPNFEQYVDSDGDGFLNKDEDDTPDDFAFEPQVDVAVETVVISNEVIISGLKDGGVSNIIISNGQLVINGQKLGGSTAQIKNGDTLQVALQSSRKFMTMSSASVALDSVKTMFEVTTDDYLPNPFTFQEVTRARVSKSYLSDTITITGLLHPLSQKHIQFNSSQTAGSAIYVNGERYTSNNFSIREGDQIWMEAVSSNIYLTTIITSLTLNDQRTDFRVLTSNDPVQEKAVATMDPYRVVLTDTKISFSIGDYIYTKTSDHSDTDPRRFYKYDPATDIWTRVADLPGEIREDAVGFAIGGKGYVGLGSSEKGYHLTDFWAYDPERNLWEESVSFPGEGRISALAFVVGENAYVGSGYNTGEVDYDWLIDFWKFSAVNNTWTRVSDFTGNVRAWPLGSAHKAKDILGWDGAAENT